MVRAAPLADNRARTDNYLHRLGGAGSRHDHAGCGPRPWRSEPVWLGVQRIHAGQCCGHRDGWKAGRPRWPSPAVSGRRCLVQRRSCHRRAGAEHACACRRQGIARHRGWGCTSSGLRGDRPQPARATARQDDGRNVNRMGAARSHRSGNKRGCGGLLRLAVDLPRLAAFGRDHWSTGDARTSPARQTVAGGRRLHSYGAPPRRRAGCGRRMWAATRRHDLGRWIRPAPGRALA